MEIIFILAVVIVGAGLYMAQRSRNQNAQIEERRSDAKAEAERWTERLGGQVLSLSGSDTASTQALADASERYNAASSALATARSEREFNLARESALEGLHYVNAARELMGMPVGPALPALEGQRQAGRVTEQRTIQHEGQTITASPHASPETPNYYPGGTVAGRPVPAGWYSTPWWAPAMASGMWSMSSMLMFSALFSGMAGAPSAAAFEQGYEEGLNDAHTDPNDSGADNGDPGMDGGDAGDFGSGLFDGFDF